MLGLDHKPSEDEARRVGVRSALVALVFLLQPGCLKAAATRAVADALSGSSGTYATDEDPELIQEAVPFGLKTMEAVLAEQPEHRGLLAALASGFTQYAFAFIQQRADELAKNDIDGALALKARAKKMYARARAYAMRGLEVAHEGFMQRFAEDPTSALVLTRREDVPLLFWMAAAWGLEIGVSKNDPLAIADFPRLEPLARRALELDEGWNKGALHEFFISFEAAAPGGSIERARAHFERAVQLSGGTRAGPYVTLAEKVCVREQNSREFHELLGKALAIDVNRAPEERLANVVMQRRAARLKAASGDLFLDDVGGAKTSTSAARRDKESICEEPVYSACL